MKEPPKARVAYPARNYYHLKVNGEYLMHRQGIPLMVPEDVAVYFQYARGVELVQYTDDKGRVLNEDGTEAYVKCDRPNLQGRIVGL